MDSGRIKPTYINGLYYLDQTFVKFLSNNGYSANDVINSTCGDTNNYTCYNNANGIYCYDENTYTNSEQTYALFNACINSEVQQLTTTKANYKNDMLYECSFKVEARPVPDDPECTDTDCPLGIDVIFRPISLDNPFPGKDADVDGRETGTNWCYGTDDCSNTNPIVTSVITNNRGVETEAIYKEREPLYIIELNPARIKEIREYNNTTTYDDFNLDCDSDGNNCKSKFIREYDFSNYFNGCGIKNSEIYRTAPQKCNPDDAW